jgi:hypothetical protein
VNVAVSLHLLEDRATLIEREEVYEGILGNGREIRNTVGITGALSRYASRNPTPDVVTESSGRSRLPMLPH